MIKLDHFSDFNETHQRDIVISHITYAVCTVVGFLFGAARLSPLDLVTSVVAMLALAHVIRIYLITTSKDIALTRAQIVILLIVSLGVLFVILFAYRNAVRISAVDSNTFNSMFVPIFLLSILSVWTDFLIAYGVRRLRNFIKGA
jgi:hypothetical protein